MGSTVFLTFEEMLMASNCWSTEAEIEFIDGLSSFELTLYELAIKSRVKWGFIDEYAIKGYLAEKRLKGYFRGKK